MTPSLHLGGAEIWICSLLKNLDRERIDLAGVATTSGTNDPVMVDSCRQAAPVFEGHDSVTRLARRADVIIAWGVSNLASLVAGFSGPVVLVAHGSCSATRWLLRAALPGATHLVAVSRAAAKAFTDAEDKLRPVTVIHNGIDVHRCRVTVPRRQVRDGWGITDGEIAVGYVGRLSAEKNPCAAALAVAALGRPFRGVFVGDPRGREEIVENVRHLCPTAVLRPPTPQVGNVFNALDCFILASSHEGFSLALTEAWLCSVPTVVTPAGAVEELESEFGALTVRVPFEPTGDELAVAVAEAISSANRPTVERARRMTSERFTTDVMAKCWVNYLLRVALG